MKSKPINQRSYVMELIETKLNPFKVKENLPGCHEQRKYRKKRKDRRRTKKQGKSNPKTLPRDSEDRYALTGTHTTTQVVGIGDVAQREVAFPDTEAELLAHVVFDENGVPHDKPEVLCDKRDAGLLPPTFASVPIWNRRQLIFGREVSFGASAAFAENSVRDRIEIGRAHV